MRNINNCVPIVCVIAAILMLSCSCGRGRVWEQSGMVWNTTYHITWTSANDCSDSILPVMKQVEMSLSPFNAGSDISAINRSESMTVDRHIIKVFEKSQEINRASGGMFDPTVAPLVNLWGFGYGDKEPAVPTDLSIDSALRLVGISQCQIAGGVMEKKSPGTQFNFSAITKGLGCDEVAAMLRRNGATDYMVEIGGELALGGLNRRGEPWRIQIDAPVNNDSSVTHRRLMVISVTDCGVATSGNYRNFRRDSEGRRFGHTISPVTGRSVETSTLSATVIAPTCMEADALATACMAMPATDALAMIERFEGAECLLVTSADDGSWRLLRSSGFPSDHENS